jgi:hypothetical protein
MGRSGEPGRQFRYREALWLIERDALEFRMADCCLEVLGRGADATSRKGAIERERKGGDCNYHDG